MKHNLTFFAIVMMALAVPQSVKAYDFEYTYQGQTLYYNIVEGNAQVTYQNSLGPHYTNLTGDLVIPDSVTDGGNTYAVTSIGNAAFQLCSDLTSVTIPDAVTYIGYDAFAFCRGLTSVTIPDGVTFISDYSFSECRGLTSITIPDAVISIGECAFENCSGLTSVTIPDGVTSIGIGAFGGCSGLTSITIPDAVTSIGIEAFYSCSGLTSIVVSSGNVTYDSRNNCNAIIETSTNTLIAGCKNTIIPTSVASIGGSAFYGCSDLSSVIIPDAVTSIGRYAFSGCYGLTSVTIPAAVTSIGDYAFEDCSGLTSIVVSSGNAIYDSRNNCNAIIETATNTLIAGCKNTIIPNSVTYIGDYAFAHCSRLTSVTIPDAITSIGEGAFYDCHGLTSVTIGNGVTSIGNYAFSYCSRLSVIRSMAENPPSCGDECFSNIDTLASVYVPCGSEEAYRTAEGWQAFDNIQCDDSLSTITATDDNGVEVYVSDGKIVICGAKADVQVYDVMGRMVANYPFRGDSNKEVEVTAPKNGVYIVKVGNLPARKIVVVR